MSLDSFAKPDEEDIIKYTEQANLAPAQRVPGIVAKAIQFGYIYPGWSMMDYLRHTVAPSPDDPVKRQGFEDVVTWGQPGTGKSNLNLQMLYGIFQNWDEVISHTIHRREELYKYYYMTTDEQVRIPVLSLDDVTTTIPKQLYFLAMREFVRLQQFIATIRPRIGVIMTNTPLPQNLISILKDMVTTEVIVFPSLTYMAEKYCWFPDQHKPVSAFLQKVCIETHTWDLYAIPPEVWKKYNDKRWTVTEEIVKGLQTGGLDPEEERIELPKVDRVEWDAVIRDKGIKIDENKLWKIINIVIAKLEEELQKQAKEQKEAIARLKDVASTVRPQEHEVIMKEMG